MYFIKYILTTLTDFFSQFNGPTLKGKSNVSR